MVEVENYDIARDLEKTWLVSFSRNVVNKGDRKDWPLLVKCFYKYPDSIMRHMTASTVPSA